LLATQKPFSGNVSLKNRPEYARIRNPERGPDIAALARLMGAIRPLNGNRRSDCYTGITANLAQNMFRQKIDPSKIPKTKNSRDTKQQIGPGLLGRLRHLANPVLPRGPLAHLFKCPLLSRLLVHPPRLHRRGNKLLIDLLKRQQLTLHISTVNTVRIIRILSTMIHIRAHRPTTTLTLSRERQTRPLEQTGTNRLDNHAWTIRPGTG
jgi:hypothetical protein